MATGLQRENAEVQIIHSEGRDYRQILQDLKTKTKLRTCFGKFKLTSLVKYLIAGSLIVAAFVAFSVTQVNQESALETLASEQLSADKSDSGITLELELSQSFQHCKGPYLKKAFPNVGYALYGYNILRGFPLAEGHDPGFTYPIFKADYSLELLSADCRFFVPDGLVLAPDISCALSISSQTVQTSYEYKKKLETYASVEASFGALGLLAEAVGVQWGISFSASFGYRQASTGMTSGHYVFALSSAKCNYYISKLVSEKAPKFDDVFVIWIHKLNNAGANTDVYFEFFDTYGTHFPTEVTFGARYSVEHKMTSKSYERLRYKGIDVKLAASYAAKFSVSGEIGLSYEQEKIRKEFSELTETRIIPVGATPPSDGNVMTWASEVKEDPIPTAYKLSSIENLFTERYMKSLDVNFKKIHDRIVQLKLDYCLHLRNLGQVESCDALVPGIELGKTRLTAHYRETAVSTISDCVTTCVQDNTCVAVTFCVSCLSSDPDFKTCFLLRQSEETNSAVKTEEPGILWQSYVFPEKLKAPYKLNNVSISGTARIFKNADDKHSNLTRCRELCSEDAYCIAFSFNMKNNQDWKCKMFSKLLITGLQKTPMVNAYFLATRNAESTTPPPANTE